MKKILIVDDNRDNRLTLELLLEEMEDIELSSASDGLEALELCKNSFYDIIFMDVMMPVMDGITSTKEIKKVSPKSMIIAASALDNEEQKKEMILSGAEDYIRKPIDSSVFIKRTQNYIELLELREKRVFDYLAFNLFTKEVFNRITTFRISNKNSLAEFWEYFMSDSQKQSDEVSDCVRILYAIGAFLLNSKNSFNIYFEEDEDRIYLTQEVASHIQESTLKSIILKHYPDGKFIYQNNNLSFMIYKNRKVLKVEKPKEAENEIKKAEEQSTPANEGLSKTEESILRKEHKSAVSASEYVDNTPINVMSKIEELEENEDELDVLIVDFERETTTEKLSIVGEKFLSYALVIEELIEFQHLAFAIESTARLLKNLNEDKLTPDNCKKIVIFLINILKDLSTWRKSIFIDKNAIDIHYLDSSLLSSCLQAEMIFNDEKSNSDEDEIEFF